jgi:hypothetical protein
MEGEHAFFKICMKFGKTAEETYIIGRELCLGMKLSSVQKTFE